MRTRRRAAPSPAGWGRRRCARRGCTRTAPQPLVEDAVLVLLAAAGDDHALEQPRVDRPRRAGQVTSRGRAFSGKFCLQASSPAARVDEVGVLGGWRSARSTRGAVGDADDRGLDRVVEVELERARRRSGRSRRRRSTCNLSLWTGRCRRAGAGCSRPRCSWRTRGVRHSLVIGKLGVDDAGVAAHQAPAWWRGW